MLTKRQSITFVAIVVGFMLIVVGCSANAPQSSGTFPTGTFVGSVSTGHAGGAELVINADGTFIITISQIKSGGTYTLNQNQVLIKSDICAPLGKDKETGIYTWSYDGSTLLFNAVQELCNDRFQVLNSVWRK